MGQIQEQTHLVLVSFLLDGRKVCGMFVERLWNVCGTFVKHLWNVCSFTVLTLLIQVHFLVGGDVLFLRVE
jgi:hypothetical protein